MSEVGHGGSGEAKRDKLQAYSALFAKLTKMFYNSESCEEVSANLHKALSSLDASERHKALSEAMQGFVPEAPHTWPPLKEALVNLGATADLPNDVQERSYAVFIMVAKLFLNEPDEGRAELPDLLSKLSTCISSSHAESGKQVRATRFVLYFQVA